MKSIRNSLIRIWLFIFIGVSLNINAQDQCKPVGWATQNGGVTGGGLGLSTTVTTYTQLKTACESSIYKVVYVSGDISLPTNGRITIQNQDGKTLFGLPGSSITSIDLTASGSGIFYIKGSTNFIMRNLVLIGPGAYDVDGNDNLTLDNCQNFWVDHCEFHDGMDGNFDMKNMTDFISVTWCKFSYEKAPIPGGSGGANDHRFSDLIGSSDNATQDDGKLRITFQYCWWGQGCVERMPRVRFGKIHIANNYYSSTVSNTCIRAGFKADLLIEGNVFENVNKPIDLYNNDFTAVTARNNTFTGTSGNTAGSGTSFTPPYTLSIAGASAIKAMITNVSCGSGATLDSPTQCGCGTTPGNVKPTVSLTAPTNNSSYCPGASINLTANAADSDGSISNVSFYRGSALIGTDNSSPYTVSWTYSISGTYTLTAVATDNLGATTTFAGIFVTINSTNIPNIAIASSALSVCSGTGITLTATSTNGGTNPTIAWFRNNIQVSTGTSYNYTPSNGDAISARLTSGGTLPACLSPTTDVSNVINLTVTPVSVPNIAISSSAVSVCSGTGITLTATSTNGGTNPTIAWFRNNVQVSTGSTYNYVPSNGDAISARLTAGGTLPACLSPTTDVSNVINLTVTPVSDPNIAISSSAASVCSGTGITLTATSTNGGSNPTIAWFRNNVQVSTGTTYNYIPSNGDAISARLTAGGTLPACLSPTTDVSNVINLTVNPVLTPSVTIASSSLSVCSGAGVSFTAAGGNLGNAPALTWLVNSVAKGTGSTLSYIPSNGDLVRVSASVAGNCLSTSLAQSNILQLTVNSPVTASLSVSPSANPVCSGTGVVYTATAVNSGSAPVYTWRVNGSVRAGTTTSFNYTPSQGDVISASVTAGGTLPSCLINLTATSSGVTALVNGTISTSISIGTSSTTVCQGSSVNFIATASGTGSAPVYAWFVNSVKQSSATSAFSYVPSNGDVVRATMTPGGNGTTCILGGTASSSGVSLSVLGVQTASVAVQASATALCAGNLASFTATSLNAGTSPTYTWYVNGAIQNSDKTFTYNPINGDNVSAKVLVGGTLPICLTTSTAVSSPLGITVNALQTPGVSIVASATSLCSGTGVVLTASGVNSGSVPSISWMKNNSVVSSGSTFSFNPANGDIISARLIVGGNLPGCLTTTTATSNALSFSVSACLKPQVSAITGPAIVLDGAQDVVYTVPNVAGDTYQWNVPSGATIVSGQGTNSIAVSFETGVSGSISMTQTNTNGSTTVQLGVTSGVPAAKPVIEGPSAVLENSNTVVYSVASVSGVTYQWTVPVGVNLVSGQATNAIVVDFGNNVRGDIGVSLTNPFGTTSASLEVSSGVTPSVGSISGLSSVLSGQTGVVYSISSISGTSYQWTVPSGATIVSGQGTNSITVNFGANVIGSVGVVATNVYGSTNGSVSISETVATSYTSISVQERFKIYPNPSQQGFTLESSVAEVKVVSIQGDTIDQFSHRLKTSFGENYPAGVYFIQLSNREGETNTVRLVKIQ